jgi:hypothetical protein
MDTRIPLRDDALIQALHGANGANDSLHPQRPGLHYVRTCQVRSGAHERRRVRGAALRQVVLEAGRSGRWLAERIERDERVVRRWFDGVADINEELLEESCPRIHEAWKARLAVIEREESAA